MGKAPEARTEIDPRPIPVMPGNVVKTDKAPTMPKGEDEEKNQAQFWSNPSDYKLGLDPQESVLAANGRWVDRPNSGLHIQFRDHSAIVKGQKLIKRLMEHPRFTLDFDIDIRDVTGYWKREGFIKVTPTTSESREIVMSKVEAAKAG